jgi:ankyrin repeat protein
MILMNAGADINFQDSSGNTALHYGCKNGHKTVVQLLLKR